MKKLVFATHNIHKLREIRQILEKTNFEILGLNDIGCLEEIPETQPTIEGNASQKSFFVYDKYGFNCFSDDTGLEIEALNGKPGVFSARYAGEGASFADNIRKVLDEMNGIENRKAKFKTVISLVLDGKEFQFEGIVEGEILTFERGNDGFGYDPIFLPKGFDQTFAEMSPQLKNIISHRGMATKKLFEFLTQKICEK